MSANRLIVFDSLSFFTTALSIAGMLLALSGYWRAVAGVSVAACLVYQVRIWLIRPLVK